MRLPRTSGKPTSTLVPSSTATETAFRTWVATAIREPGLALVATNIRFRDGSFSNFNNTDLSGDAGFNEIFPLFNWYIIETDTTRYKTTGVTWSMTRVAPPTATLVRRPHCAAAHKSRALLAQHLRGESATG